MARDLRRLTIEDYDRLLSVWADSGLPYKPSGRDSREMIAKEMALPQCAFFGLIEDDHMIAVGLANFDGRRGWINRVAVDPDRRGEGIASEIIDVCETFLRQQGAVVICALIEDMNYPSISCFQTHGFVFEGEIGYFTKRDSSDS